MFNYIRCDPEGGVPSGHVPDCVGVSLGVPGRSWDYVVLLKVSLDRERLLAPAADELFVTLE